jgi:hypothetical protein
MALASVVASALVTAPAQILASILIRLLVAVCGRFRVGRCSLS